MTARADVAVILLGVWIASYFHSSAILNEYLHRAPCGATKTSTWIPLAVAYAHCFFHRFSRERIQSRPAQCNCGGGGGTCFQEFPSFDFHLFLQSVSSKRSWHAATYTLQNHHPRDYLLVGFVPIPILSHGMTGTALDCTATFTADGASFATSKDADTAGLVEEPSNRCVGSWHRRRRGCDSTHFSLFDNSGGSHRFALANRQDPPQRATMALSTILTIGVTPATSAAGVALSFPVVSLVTLELELHMNVEVLHAITFAFKR